MLRLNFDIWVKYAYISLVNFSQTILFILTKMLRMFIHVLKMKTRYVKKLVN